jgi:hypothetical protein
VRGKFLDGSKILFSRANSINSAVEPHALPRR